MPIYKKCRSKPEDGHRTTYIEPKTRFFVFWPTNGEPFVLNRRNNDTNSSAI